MWDLMKEKISQIVNWGEPTWSLWVLVNNSSKINPKIMKHCTVHSVSTGFCKKLSNASAHPCKWLEHLWKIWLDWISNLQSYFRPNMSRYFSQTIYAHKNEARLPLYTILREAFTLFAPAYLNVSKERGVWFGLGFRICLEIICLGMFYHFQKDSRSWPPDPASENDGLDFYNFS